jgi:hypothetical protein
MARLVVTAIIVALLAVPIVGSSASAAKPKCQGFTATIVGNNKPNVIKGTNRRDVIVSKGGNDKVFGRGGNDVICSGPGKDTVKGGSGKDRIYGGDKNDILSGGSSWDVLDGGKGKDACYVGSGSGREVRCEEADLRVTVVAPSTAFIDIGFGVTVLVKNIGIKTARGVQLNTDFGSVNANCDASDDSETLVDLPPTFYQFRTIPNECDASGIATLTASATTTSAEDILANNSAEAASNIVKP